jgi:RNA polymerase primary sigma factor
MRQLKISRSITNRESPSLEKYLREISRLDMIAGDEEVQLMERIRRGDHSAKDKLVKANLRFVVSVAKQYQGQGMSLPDLINEGNVGLIKSVEKFDPTRGFKFISFAVWWIRQSIIHALADQSRMIRLPLNKVATRSRIRAMSAKLEQQLDRQPTAEELSFEMGIPSAEIEMHLSHQDFHTSLDSPINEDEESTLMETVENPNAEKTDEAILHSESLCFELKRCLNVLPPRYKDILCCYFGIGCDYPMSLDEIGKRFEITTERVRQIRDKALHRLREAGNLESLRSFLRA